MTTRLEFADAVVAAGRWPVTTPNEQALVTVMVAEGSHARWNPLDTTEPEPGAGDYNSAGVRNYVSLAQGVQATVATLTNGDYGEVLAALAAGDDAEAVVKAFAASPWGTWSTPGPALADLHTVQATWPAYGQVTVTGTGETASGTPTPPTSPIGDPAMIASDPISHGMWVARPDGAVYAFGGAPYLGGLNNHPEWGRGGSGQPQCTGIAYDYGTHGYVLSVDGDGLAEPEVYRFPRTGVYS